MNDESNHFPFFYFRFLIVSIGCDSKKAPSGIVAGTIKYKGEPVNNALLVLYSASGETYNIPASDEGAFRVVDVPDGDYKVVIQPTKDSGPNTKGMTKEQKEQMKSKIESMKNKPTIKIPDKYKDRLKTDLTLNVTKGEHNVELTLKD